MDADTHDETRLRDFAAALLQRAGLAADRAAVVAAVLVEGDMLGRTTHGLALLPGYLGALADGSMRAEGDPDTVSDRGSTVLLDGRRLPGPWLVQHAIDLALERVAEHGTVTVVIRRSHHIACLAAYLERVTATGRMILLMSSDPSVASVAPHGGTRAFITPNPMAAGIPTPGRPILMDVSTSATTNGLTGRLRSEARRLDHPWVLDSQGRPTDDPAALFTDPPGTILPLGGVDSGHKGFALGLLVEALTAALGGFGRAEPGEGWGAAVYLQVIDPAAFGGLDPFLRQTGWLADAVGANPPRPGVSAPRLPGARGLGLRDEMRAAGVRLYPGIVDALNVWADRLHVERFGD
jgi:LDH2 family malate/lactate/ureidoglycolate dehydrogenase